MIKTGLEESIKSYPLSKTLRDLGEYWSAGFVHNGLAALNAQVVRIHAFLHQILRLVVMMRQGQGIAWPACIASVISSDKCATTLYDNTTHGNPI